MNTNIFFQSKWLIVLILLMTVALSSVCHADEGHEHEQVFTAFSLIHPLGLTALILLLLTFGTGIFRKKLKHQFMLIHKILAGLAAAAAISHGILVFALD